MSLSLALALLVVSEARWGPDWPAQEFRAALAHNFGLLAWNNNWYGGHALPGYSALYPLVAAVIGASATGAGAVIVTAWASQRLLPASATIACRWSVAVAVTTTTVSSLLIGQVPFLMGLAMGTAALVTLLDDRRKTTVVLAAACSAASPLAALFLLLTGYALATTMGWRRVALLLSALVGPAIAAVVGGAGGAFPCPWEDMAGGLVFCAIVWLGSRPSDAVLRRLSGAYAVIVVFAFLVPSPLGGNVNRLAVMLALPLAAWALTRDGTVNRRFVIAAVVAAVALTALPLSSNIRNGAPDPSRQASFYAGLLGFLRTQNPIAGRLEVPLTRAHWESAFVAPVFPLARGWERQLDIQDNAALYQPLTAAGYKLWLDNAGVAMIALANAPIDYAGTAEARLLKNPPPYLHEVYADRFWRVWRVVGAQPLITGAARMTRLGPASFVAYFDRGGSAVVRLRASALWQVAAGSACLDSTADGWLRLTAPGPGPVTVRARVNAQLITGVPDCDDTAPS